MGVSHDLIRANLAALMPQGALWEDVPDTDKAALLDAFADALARIYDRAEMLIRESNPLFAGETFPAKEIEAGLPDACQGDDASLVERREALLTRWRARGGQSPAYFVALADSIGVPVEIEEYPPFSAGSSTGEAINNDGWQHHWAVIAPDNHPKDILVAGQGCAGDPLRKWGNQQLECLIAKYAPAHATHSHKYI